MKASFIGAAAIALFGWIGTAQAATLNGLFYVTAINVLNQNATQSEATLANAQNALNEAMAGTGGYSFANFEYTGDLDFATNNGSATTIGEWLATGVNGSVVGVSPNFAAFSALQMSKGDVKDGTATTTFFSFTKAIATGAADFTVTHDDGFALYQITDVAKLIGGVLGPTTVKTTPVSGFTGGIFGMIYVATNSDPSILKVDVAPVPLPAAFPLLAAGLAALGLMRLRRKAS